MADQQLPDDLIMEIVVRLPVKSIVQFKIVSKSWCAVIKSPAFVNRHLKHDRKETVLLRNFSPLPSAKSSCIGSYILSLHDPYSVDLSRLSPKIPIPFLEQSIGNYPRIVGPCNGLFLITHARTSILCNPALREFRALPPREVPSIYQGKRPRVYYGLGFDPVNNGSYKVVGIYVVRLLRGPPSISKVELYDSASNSWQIIDSTHEMLPYVCRNFAIFFKGACHWEAGLSHPGVILSFDVSTRVFRDFEFPKWSDDVQDYRLSVSEDHHLTSIAFPEWTRSPSFIDVWVMEEYGVKESWVRTFKIELNSRIGEMLFTWKDEWVLILDHNSQPTSLDLGNGELRRTFTFCERRFLCLAFLFKESLISLDEVICCNDANAPVLL